MTQDLTAIIEGLSCDRPGCECASTRRRGVGLLHCPSHEDERPSLSVTETDAGKVLLKCHGGCVGDQVIEALRDRGLWGAPAQVERRQIVATYDYLGRDGAFVFQVVRFQPKGFSQRRLDGETWVWNMEGVERVLYQLPAVVKAVEMGNTVWIVEGEKDADALATLGLCATTSPGGAGKWSDSYVADLVNADIVIIADRDEPHPQTGRRAGIDHAREIATSCQLAASSVKILELPGDGKDFSDWFAAGGSRDVLVALAKKAPLWGAGDGRRILTGRDLVGSYTEVLERRQAGDPDYVGIPTLIPNLDRYVAYRPGDLWLVVAATGVGKTSFLATMQRHLDQQGVVSLLASLEQPAVQLMDRWLAAATGLDSWKIAQGQFSMENWIAINEALQAFKERVGLLVDDPSMTTSTLEVIAKVAKMRGAKVLFVDYAQRLADRGADTEYLRVSRIADELARIARDTRLCIVAASQVSKKGMQQDGEPPLLVEIRETGKLAENASVVLAIGRKEREASAQVAIRKNRNGMSGIVLPLLFDATRARFISRTSGPSASETAPWVKD